MKRFSLFAVRCVLLAGAFALAITTANAQGARQLPAPNNSDLGSADSTEVVDETAQNWFVELSSSPTSDGTSLATVRAEKQAFRQAAKAAKLQYTERRAFDSLWNGLSIHMDKSQLSSLTRIAGVKAIYPVIKMSYDEASSPNEPELSSAIAMTGADIVQNSLGFTGAGVKVAVIDTGIDYDHPDLGGCFGSGCRVEKGWDFVGDAYNADLGTTPVPDPNPDDCAGHGTHVSGIIGANGGVKGVAPGVTFYAYRVFGCVGSTDSDIMLAAMERALADGAQVVNMSIGSAFQWPQYPSAMASNRLVNNGVVVVASIGNSGANGLYAAGAPGVGSKVIGVASVDNTFNKLKAFTVNPGSALVGFNEAAAAPPAPTSGTFTVLRTGTPTTTNDACIALAAGSLSGKVALIRRGTCSFYQKSFNAQNAGAAGVILYNNTTGLLSPTVAGSPAITIPVVAISAADGVAINNLIVAGATTMTWGTQTIGVPSATGGLISSFSSYGLAADLSFKPDISAPGGNIFSTYPLELGGYASLSGTSMSSPHTAGIAALYLQAHPNTSSNAMRSILQNSARPGLWSLAPQLGLLDITARQGAGLVQADKAILATTRIEPGTLALGESEAGPVTRSLRVTNNGANSVAYDLSFVDAVSPAGTFVQSFFIGDSSVTFSVSGAPVNNISLLPGQSVDLAVTIAPDPSLPDTALYGGYIVFTPQGGGQTLRVAYSGFKGDYQSIVAMAPTANAFPWLARLSGGSLFKQNAGETFTFQGGDQPYVVIHFDHQVRSLNIEVIGAVSGKSYHRAYFQEYLARNSTSTGIFAFPFDGTTVNSNKVNIVPNGQYYLKVTAVKALGDSSNPAHVETWTSPAFNIARP